MSNSIQFSEQFYLSTYPDVAAAVSRGVFASGQAHYNANGRFEGRNPNQFFNTSEYLGRYPDVARAGVNPLDHFLRSGAAEGRFANSNEDGVIDLNNNDIADDFNAAAYLAQYPDVAAQTGAGRPFATAYQHFVQFGQFEGRTATLSNGTTVTGPFVNGGTTGGATGSSFSLTTGIDNLTGTSGNDTFTADNTTLQATDTISGGQGIDTLNITDGGTTGGNIAAATVTGVEVINVRNVNGTASVPGANETVTLVFSDVAGGTATTSTVTVGGQTVTTTAGGTLTGTDLATRFGTANLPAGYTFVSQTGNQLVLRSTAASNVPDIAVSATPGAGAGAAAAAPSRAIVQGVDASGGTGVADTVSAANFVGATSFNSVNSTNALNVNDLAQGQSVGITGNGSTTNGNVNAAYATAATSATINVNGGTKAGTIAVTGTGLTSTTVNSTGAANTLTGLTLAAATTTATIAAATNLTTGTLTAAGLTTLNVSGAASSVNVGTLSAAVTTVDASGLTVGGLTATLDAAITSFKGGQGNDVVTTAAITATTANIINAGAGTADRLVIGATGDVNTAAKAQQYAGFEVLQAGTGVTVDASLFTNSAINAVRLSGTVTANGLNATQAGNITVTGDATPTIGVTGAATPGQIDVVKLTVDDGAATVSTITLANVVATGVETLQFVANDKLVVQSLAGVTEVTNISVTGSQDTSITTTNLFLNANTTLDASALTGKFTFVGTAALGNGIAVTGSSTAVNNITGTNFADKIVGGAGVDTIVGGTGADILTGGAGADTFTFATTATGTPTSTNFDTITDFAKSSDIIDLSGTAISFQSNAAASAGTAAISASGIATFNSADTTLDQQIAAVAAGINAGTNNAGESAIFQNGSDSYVFISDGTAAVGATDILIKLTGVTGLTAGTINAAGDLTIA